MSSFPVKIISYNGEDTLKDTTNPAQEKFYAIKQYASFLSHFQTAQAAFLSTPAKVGLGYGIYDTIVRYMHHPENGMWGPSAQEYRSVYEWIKGARDVNNNSSAAATYIREYTKNQYLFRFGAEKNLDQALQIASNQIALTFGNLIEDLAGKALPTLETIGIIDGGRAASMIFKNSGLYPNGDYTGWAGTVLFAFLGHDKFYRDWLLTESSVKGSVSSTTTSSSITIKHYEGTYDLFASYAANLKTLNNLPLLTKGQLAWSFLSIIDVSHEGLIAETNAFLRSVYELPSTHRFSLDQMSPLGFTSILPSNTGIVMGTHKADKLIVARPLAMDSATGTDPYQHYLVHAGEGNDTIAGQFNYYFGAEVLDLIVDGGGGVDTLDYKWGNAKTLPLKIQFSAREADQTMHLMIERHNANGLLIGTHYINNVEILIATDGDDVIRVLNLPSLAGNPKYEINLGEGTDTLDWRDANVSLNLVLDNNDKLKILDQISGNSIPLIGLENIIGGKFNDHIEGNSKDNVISPGRGTNTIDGGSGFDTLDYSKGSYEGVFATMSNATVGNGVEIKVKKGSGIDSAKNFEAIIGTSYDDAFSFTAFPTNLGSQIFVVDLQEGRNILNWNVPGTALILTDNSTIRWNNAGTISIPSGSSSGQLQVGNIHTIVAAEADDVIYANNSGSILAAGGGKNVVVGGLGSDTFVVSRGETIIRNADSTDKLYIPFVSIDAKSTAADQAIWLKGGLHLVYSNPQSGLVTLSNNNTADFYSGKVDGLQYRPEELSASSFASIDTVFARFTLKGSALQINILTQDETGTWQSKVTVENYKPGDLGLKFTEQFVPDITLAALDQYVPITAPEKFQHATEQLFEVATLPYVEGVWYG